MGLIEMLEHGYAEEDPSLMEDSDAEPSVIFPELEVLGRLLVDAGGDGPSWALRTLQCGYVVYVVVVAPGFLTAQLVSSGLTEPNALLYLANVLTALAVLATLPVLGSAHAALRPNGGALQALGAGKVWCP